MPNTEVGIDVRSVHAGEGFQYLAMAAGLLLAAFLVAACHPPEGRTLTPLKSSSLEPDVLVEAPELALRPSLDGNRFLSGWRPVRRGGTRALVLRKGGARLELVELAERPRTLALDLVDGAFDPDGRVSVRAAGRDLGSRPLADPLEIPLPADLPLGRVLVELALETAGTPLQVREARVRPALPAGEARWQDGELVQSGASRVDFVVRPGAGESLVGRLSPPSGARPEQRFRIRLEREDGALSVPFEWAPGFADRFRSHRFEIPLGDGGGLVRVSLEAAGEGPPAHWSGLAVSAPAAAPADDEEELPADFAPPGVVVLYVMDALRADAPSFSGGLPGTTPVLDRLAREGMSFREHRSVAPNTLPSTKALVTGEAWVDRGGWKLPAAGAATLAELFRRAGYRTGLFTGNSWVGPAYGVDRGFEHVSEVTLAASSPYNDNGERLREAALAWLRKVAGDRVFLYIHAVHPHNPYDPPEPWRSELTRGVASDIDGSTATLLAIGRRKIRLDEADRERLRRLYAGGLAYNDAQIGRFLDELGRLFPGEQALVAVTSDHGEELFDHGGVLHGYTLYEEMIRIPLVVWSPGLVVPGEYRGPTSTLDLHATLAEIAARAAGLAPESLGEGRSLLGVLLGRQERRAPEVHLAAAASVKGGIYSVQSARWKLVWAPRTGLGWGMGGGPGRTHSPEYLFDLAADPRELDNRAGEGGLEVAWMRSRLRAWIEAKRARGEEADEAVVDEETRKRLEALGYVD